MVPDPFITANEVLISVTVFTTGFLSVRIHGERLRLLEQRDAVRNKLLDATASGQPVLHIAAPSGGEFDLAKIGGSLLLVNFSILLMLLTIQFIASRIAGWAWKWPADAEFWFFAAVDIVETVLVVIAFADWRAVRDNLRENEKEQPWTSLTEAWCLFTDAVDYPVNDRKRAIKLDGAEAKLLLLEMYYRTWLEPLQLHVMVQWLRGGAGYVERNGLQEKIVALMPNDPAPLLSLAHLRTCAYLFSPEHDDTALSQAKQEAEKAIALATTRSMPQEVVAAGQEALGDIFLASHDWTNAASAYQKGVAASSSSSGATQHHRWRCRVKQAIALIGQGAHSAQTDPEKLNQAIDLLRRADYQVIHEASGEVSEEGGIGLWAGRAVALLLAGNSLKAVAMIREALLQSRINRDNLTLRLDHIHLELIRNLIVLQSAELLEPSDLETMVEHLETLKKELKKIIPYDESEYVPVILLKIASALQANIYEQLGDEERATIYREESLRSSYDPPKPVLLTQNDQYVPLNVLLGGWVALEIHDQGFFQSPEKRRNRVGPRFLTLEHDPTADLWDYVAMNLREIIDNAHKLAAGLAPPRFSFWKKATGWIRG
jgi:tetratricopeptide (TPR) repeat protein